MQNLFSPELDLRLPKLNLISSNERGDYKRLLFWSYEIKFEIFGITPTVQSLTLGVPYFTTNQHDSSLVLPQSV